MTSLIKGVVRRSRVLYTLAFSAKRVCEFIISKYTWWHGGGYIKNKATYSKIKRDIIGKGNEVVIGSGCKIHGLLIYVRGNNNRLIIGEDVRIYGGGNIFWLQGDGNTIRIGGNSTFNGHVHLFALEQGTEIEMGEDCMFANHIIVMTGDFHSVLDMATGTRTNPARSVKIGNHVWVAPDSRILKGVTIGDNCIISSNSVVTKDIPSGSLVVGVPCRIARENVTWSRERL